MDLHIVIPAFLEILRLNARCLHVRLKTISLAHILTQSDGLRLFMMSFIDIDQLWSSADISIRAQGPSFQGFYLLEALRFCVLP